MTDSEIDRRLEAALGIEPSPEFLARVRTRVASEPERSRWRLGIVEPLVGLAIAGIVLAVVVPQWMREARPAPPVAHDVASVRSQRATDGSLSNRAREVGERLSVTAPAEDVFREGRRLGVAATSPQASSAAETPLRLSPVVFSADERQALLTLVHAVEEGRVPPLPAATQAAEQFGEMRALRIDPLVIEPLPQLARLELGASQ